MALKDILRASAEAEVAQLKATNRTNQTDGTKPTQLVKNKGGRPKKDAGELRKQYTLTLRPETYQLVMQYATKAELSFAKYMERAVMWYMENHEEDRRGSDSYDE